MQVESSCVQESETKEDDTCSTGGGLQKQTSSVVSTLCMETTVCDNVCDNDDLLSRGEEESASYNSFCLLFNLGCDIKQSTVL